MGRVLKLWSVTELNRKRRKKESGSKRVEMNDKIEEEAEMEE